MGILTKRDEQRDEDRRRIGLLLQYCESETYLLARTDLVSDVLLFQSSSPERRLHEAGMRNQVAPVVQNKASGTEQEVGDNRVKVGGVGSHGTNGKKWWFGLVFH